MNDIGELVEMTLEFQTVQTSTDYGVELFITLRAKMNMQDNPLEYSRTCEFDELP